MAFDLATARPVEPTQPADGGFDMSTARPAAGLQPPARAPMAQIPVDPTLTAPPTDRQIASDEETARRQAFAQQNPIAEKIAGAVEGALDIIAKLGGGMVGGLAGAYSAPFRGESMEQGFVEGGATGVGIAQQGLGLLNLGSGAGPRTETGQLITEGADRVLQNLPAAGGVYGTLAGPAMNAGAAARQVAAPVAQVARQGLDMAGGAVQRGADVVRGLRQPAAAQPTPGTQGSAGAAGTDAAMVRRQRAAGLPYPVKLTNADATGDLDAQSFERETAKEGRAGRALRENKIEQNSAIQKNFNILEEQIGTKTTNREEIGQAVLNPLAAKRDRKLQEIRDEYKKARDAGETEDLVDTDGIVGVLNDSRSSETNAGVIKTAADELVRLGGATRGPDGLLVAGRIKLDDLEEIRKTVGIGGKKDLTNSSFASKIRGAIDRSTEGAGGEAYASARRLYRDYAAEFNDQGIIKSLIGLKKNSSDRLVATEKIVDKVIGGSLQDVRNLRRSLASEGEAGTQAWREIQGAVVRDLHDATFGNAGRNEARVAIVSPSGLSNAVKQLDRSGKLEEILGKQGAIVMRDLAEVASDVFTPTADSVNTSGTGAYLKRMLLDMATSAGTGIPVPWLTATKFIGDWRRDRKTMKRVSDALAQPNPELFDPKSRRGQISFDPDATPPKPPNPPPPERIPVGQAKELPPETGRGLNTEPIPAGKATELAPETAAALAPSKRERDLLRLRENVTDPEIQKDLDRAITAERKRAAEETRGQEYLKLADATTDPELRAGFEARAKKLGVVRPKDEPVPAGEATELAVETVDPVGQAPNFDPTPEQLTEWQRTNKFGTLDAKAAQDIDTALKYDAEAVKRAQVQHERQPEVFRKAINRIIEEGKARESQAEPPAGGSTPTPGDPGSQRPRGEGPGQGPDDGGTPVAPVRGGPRAPDGQGGGGGQARADAEGVAPPAPPAARQGPLTDREIVNPIDPKASPADKVRQLERLTEQNKPIVQSFIRKLDAALGTNSSDNVKRSDNILAKASRPAILAAKPWHGVEHIRDSYRFKSVIGSVEDLPKAIERLAATGVEIVKADVDKVLRPKEFGWRISVFDLRMPNGQLVEYYLPVRELEIAKKTVGHELFEEVRGLDVSIPEQRAKFDELAAQSRKVYQEAWSAYLARTGETEISVRAALDKASAVASSSLSNPSRKAAGLRSGEGDTQRPDASRRAEKVPGPNTAADRPPSSATNASTSAIASTSASIISERPAGRVTIVTTERGMEVRVRYRLVDADDLITSNDDALNVNPRYPAEMQPRDRTRGDSALQVAKIANDIRPDWMADSPKASDGAPIIGADGVVESGNGRTIALRRAYAMGKADHYQKWLVENADRFGLTADDVRGLKRPMLVRQGLGKYDRAEFAYQANEPSVADMSATERAGVDVARLPSLEGLRFDEAGNVDASASADWIRAYVQNTIGPNKRAEVMTATGELSQSGNTRIRNAVLMKAYNDKALVERVAESLDPGTKNVLNGLSRAAPDVAKLQDMAAAGAREAPTWVPDLVDAVRRFADAREAGQTVNEYLSQGSLLGGEATPSVSALMVQIEGFSRAPKRLADHIRALVRESMKDPRQGELMEPQAIYKVKAQTESPEFKRWFGDSKVVDAEGKPLVVYHGTTNDFSVFGQSADMGYHFGSAKVASKRITDLADNRELRGPDRIRGAQVMPVHLAIRNPLHMGADHGDWRFVRVYRELMRRGIITKERFEKAKDQRADEFYRLREQGGVDDPSEQADAFMMRKLRNDLEALGYDGISYLNEVEGAGKTVADRKANPDNLSWIAFRPEQIKSAFGNRGTFDPADANITREPEPLLRAQTPADLKAKTGREAAALKADQAEQKRLADKARADAMAAEFTLTGSDRAADNPNQGSLFEKRPQDPTTPYETDLFGAPVVPPAQRARPRRGGLQPPTGADRDMGAATGLSGAPPGEYATRAALVTTRQQQLGHAGRVNSLADAAHALAYLNKSAVERFDALVTDMDGNPLAVIGGFKGALSQASVYPATLLGEAMQVPKAANLWMSHNHPSGTTALSAADENLASNIASAFDGTGIKVRGIIAAGSDKWGGATPSRKGSVVFDDRISDRPLQPAQGSTVPAQERQLVESGKLGPAIQSPADAKALVRKLVHQNAYRPTIILLDSQHQPVAAVPWSVDDAMPLKDNGKLDRLLRAVATSNAGTALIGTGDGRTGGRVLSMDQAQNIGAALAKADVRVLDIIDANGGSAAEKGLNTRAAVLRSVGAGGAALAVGSMVEGRDDAGEES